MADGGIETGQSVAAIGSAASPAGTLLCASIIAADPHYRTLAAQAAVSAMEADGVAPVWVGNPLGTPMSVQRLLTQAGDIGGACVRPGEAEARLADAVARNADHPGRAVLVISQSETLDPAALPVLQRVAGGPDAVRILFVGAPEFWPLLDGPGLAPLRRALDRPEPAVAPRPRPQVIDPKGQVPPEERSTRVSRVRILAWTLGGLVLLALLAGAGVVAVLAPGGLFYRAEPQRLAYHISTAAPAAAAAPARVPADPAPAEPAPVHAPAATGADGRVVIHYRNGSGPGEAAANRFATLAAPLAARVQTRGVPITPTGATIRYFHPEDEARAHELAVALRGPDAAWDVKNAGSMRPLPSAGTVEVWVPVR